MVVMRFSINRDSHDVTYACPNDSYFCILPGVSFQINVGGGQTPPLSLLPPSPPRSGPLEHSYEVWGKTKLYIVLHFDVATEYNVSYY